MQRIIDTNVNVSAFAGALKSAGVGTVIRYYCKGVSKRLGPDEAQTLAAAGLSLAVVYEDRAGAENLGGSIADLTATTGAADALRALEQAHAVGQSAGSAIYFAVDRDFVKPSELASIKDYFAAVKDQIGGRYKIGVYGSGLVSLMVEGAGLVDYIWLSLSTGWTGYQKCAASGKTTLLQKSDKAWPGGGFSYDENVPAQGVTDIGAFALGGGVAPVEPAPTGTLFSVNARGGLNLRRGPGVQFEVARTLVFGTIVHGMSQVEGWTLVDIEGDGQADGYLSTGFLTHLA